MLRCSSYEEALTHLARKPIVTIATGATCAYLGDERNLREFLVADEAAKRLRAAGHTVFSLLIDDSLDPLTFRQLRVAVNKDEELISQYKDSCGKPIALLPDPWGCHDSYAAHFESELLDRLHHLNCHPSLVSTSKLYQSGVYAPYVQQVLERHTEIREFLHARFPGYQPEKLFWVLCPDCGYIDETRIEGTTRKTADVSCGHCERSRSIAFTDIQGKLNWKLDCAVRWALFSIDAEPFTKSYLEPQAGSVAVAQALSEEFFGGHSVLPLHYGTVKMDKALGHKLLQSLPPSALRALLVEKPSSDLTLTDDLIVTTASRHAVLPGLSYLDFARQVLPIWLLTPGALSPQQRELLAQGVAFSRHFLGAEVRLHLPTRAKMQNELPEVLRAAWTLLTQVIDVRLRSAAASQPSCLSEEEQQQVIKELAGNIGGQKKAVLHLLRGLTGQEQGLPVARLLSLLPLDYLQLLSDLLDLSLTAQVNSPAATVSLRLAA